MFAPRHPEKYKGNARNIVFRSSWERKAMTFFDGSSSVLFWSSEEIVLGYMSPIDKRMHRYFVDFWVKFINANGEETEALVEIKPANECKMPRKPVKQTPAAQKRYENRVRTYMVNLAKWEAARKFCVDKGWNFIVATEKTLKIK